MFFLCGKEKREHFNNGATVVGVNFFGQCISHCVWKVEPKCIAVWLIITRKTLRRKTITPILWNGFHRLKHTCQFPSLKQKIMDAKDIPHSVRNQSTTSSISPDRLIYSCVPGNPPPFTVCCNSSVTSDCCSSPSTSPSGCCCCCCCLSGNDDDTQKPEHQMSCTNLAFFLIC